MIGRQWQSFISEAQTHFGSVRNLSKQVNNDKMWFISTTTLNTITVKNDTYPYCTRMCV